MEVALLLNSLRFRITASVVLIILTFTCAGFILDYRREYETHLEELFATLHEQARSLQLARAHIKDREDFPHYVDQFCAQMNEHVSPGHHILVLNRAGEVIVHARHHSGPEVENALLLSGHADQVIRLGNQNLAHVRLTDDDGTTIVLAQYMDRSEEILRTQLISRIVTATATALAAILLVYLAMNAWVLRPLARLGAAAKKWSARDFAARSKLIGPSDLRNLTRELNVMAGELERHDHARLAELERAREIQANLLPTSLPAVPGLTVIADYQPAKHVAGDLYDIFELPDGRTAIAILDVAGHDISAALLTGVVKMSLHRRLAERTDPAEAMALVNGDLLACISNGQFVTACVGLWDGRERRWTYCSAGHPGGVHLAQSGVVALDSTGPLLGVLPDAQWTARQIDLLPGDRLFLYTDGIVEAGLGDRALGQSGLERAIIDSASMPLRQQVEAIMAEARRHNLDHLMDDMTVVALEAVGQPTPALAETLSRPDSNAAHSPR